MRGMLIVGLVGLVGCGGPVGNTEDETMFERVNEAKLGYTLPGDLLPGKSAQLLQISAIPEGQSEPFIITLWPGADMSLHPPRNTPDKVTAILGLYARIESGNGSASALPAIEVDFGQGIAFPWRGRSITITAVNSSDVDAAPGIAAKGVTAFLSRGYFTPQVPKRTLPGRIAAGPNAGKVITPLIPLPAGDGTGPVLIPPFAQQLEVQFDPSYSPFPTPYPCNLLFSDAAGNDITSIAVFSGDSITVPSDAYQIELSNPGATALTGLRFVFALGGF